MWAKEFDVARWNGREITILKTDRDQGRRIQVDEMPNSDQAYTRDMGKKTATYKVEIVFVGDQSLEASKDFEAALHSEPSGCLEHPEYGELELTYEKSTQSISTKRGIVVLSVDFYLTGREVSIPPLSSKKAASLTKPAMDNSIKQFEKEVKAATPDRIVAIQTDFYGMLGKLRNIASQAQRPGVKLAALHRQINDAFAAITSIANAPASFARQVQATSESLVSQLKSIPSSTKSLTDPKAYAIHQVRETEKESNVQHVRMQSTMTCVQISESIETASSAESPDDLTTSPIRLDQIKTEVALIEQSVADRINESTGESTFESLELYDSLRDLKTEIAMQSEKIKTAEQKLQQLSIYSPTPSFCLAYMADCTLGEFEGLNSIRHPLFIEGKVRVPSEK